MCKCVLYYCHRVSTQLQLTYISISTDHLCFTQNLHTSNISHLAYNNFCWITFIQYLLEDMKTFIPCSVSKPPNDIQLRFSSLRNAPPFYFSQKCSCNCFSRHTSTTVHNDFVELCCTHCSITIQFQYRFLFLITLTVCLQAISFYLLTYIYIYMYIYIYIYCIYFL